MNTRSQARRRDWQVPILLVTLSAVPVAAGIARLAELAGDAATTVANARFHASPLPVLLHILTAIPYSLLGAFMLAPALRQRWPAWHRAAGRVLLPCGLAVALSGLWMTLFYAWPEGDGAALYLLRLVFGSAMTLALLLAAEAIRKRDFVAHGAWMIRAYAIALGAGTQVLTHLPYYLLAGKPGETARALLMAAGWVINVAVAEWVIRKGIAHRAVGHTQDTGRTSPREDKLVETMGAHR